MGVGGEDEALGVAFYVLSSFAVFVSEWFDVVFWGFTGKTVGAFLDFYFIFFPGRWLASRPSVTQILVISENGR